jgi:hypothetical protein
MKARPKIGDLIVSEITVNVCSKCGYLLDEFGGCDYNCPLDLVPLDLRKYIVSTWKRVDEFLGDEVVESGQL